MASTDMTYTGHDTAHAGLQRHSLGDHYPWICVVLGSGDHYFLNGCTGEEGPRFGTYKAAVRWLEATINARRELAETRH